MIKIKKLVYNIWWLKNVNLKIWNLKLNKNEKNLNISKRYFTFWLFYNFNKS